MKQQRECPSSVGSGSEGACDVEDLAGSKSSRDGDHAQLTLEVEGLTFFNNILKIRIPRD